MQKKLIPLFALLIVVLIFLAGFKIFNNSKKSTTPTNNTNQNQNSSTTSRVYIDPKDAATTLKTFTSKQFGFSIEYPSNITAEERSNGYVVVNKNIIIKAINSNQSYKLANTANNKEEKVKIGSFDAIKVTGDIKESHLVGYIPPQKYQSYVIKSKVNTYVLTLYELGPDADFKEADFPPNRKIQLPDDQLKLFNQVANSFKVSN
jgi:hypothetical protein